jgi:hypothetical protein
MQDNNYERELNTSHRNDHQVQDTDLEESVALLNPPETFNGEYIVKNATKHRNGMALTIMNLANDDISVGLLSAPYFFNAGGTWWVYYVLT